MIFEFKRRITLEPCGKVWWMAESCLKVAMKVSSQSCLRKCFSDGRRDSRFENICLIRKVCFMHWYLAPINWSLDWPSLMLKHKTRFFAINAIQVMIRKLLLPFSQLVDIKEPSVLVESVLWTPYSLEYESNHPCSCSVWQSCVSICYFQIVLQSANKTGCLRRWWGSPSCSSSAPAPLPQHYKQRLYVMSQPQHMPLALGEKGEPSPPLVRWKQKFSRNKTK